MNEREAECHPGQLFYKHQGKNSIGILGSINSQVELIQTNSTMTKTTTCRIRILPELR